MTTIRTTGTSKRRWAWTWLFLVLVAAPATLALALAAALAIGPLGLAAPLLVMAALYIYRAVVASSVSADGRAVAREVGALVLAPALGFGTWVALLVLGIAIEVLPFLTGGRAYPYADEWNALSVVAAVAAAGGAWWLLRRWADPALRSQVCSDGRKWSG